MKNGTSTSELGETQLQETTFALVNVESELQFLAPHDEHAADDMREFLERVALQTRGDKHMRVIVYCANARRGASTRAAKVLIEAGYTDILEYRAGQEVWHCSPQGFRGRPGNRIASGEHRSASLDDAAASNGPAARGGSDH